jgi:esterase/lipase superfamily enzyme
LFKQHELIASESMGRHVHLWRYGSFGAPVLVFPSAAGMAHEWDSHGMVDALAPLIDNGKVKLYCTESNVAEAWTRRESDPQWRMQRHRAFESYVIDELVPWIRNDCRTPDISIAATGTSLGATYSANFALKFPQTFRYALCMSGQYDITRITDGFNNTDVYFNNPVAYASNLDGEHLESIRAHTHLTLVCGQGKWEDGNIEDTHNLAAILGHKGIRHLKDMWGRDVHHEWDSWRRQAAMHLSHQFGR